MIWSEPPGPPWFVHVDIIASRDARPCVWPHELRVHVLTDDLIADARRPAVALGHVVWSGRGGELFLTPPYPAGGEIGGHLAFCYSAAGVNYAVTLHAWTRIFRFTVRGVRRAESLGAKPSAPSVIATLRRVVSSAH